MDLGAQRSQGVEGEPWFVTKPVVRGRFVRHPGGNAGDRPIGLGNDDQLSTTVGVLLGNEHRLTAPGMERIVNPPLDRVLVRSMSLFRAKPGSGEHRCSARAGAWQNCAAACAASPA